MGNERHDKVQLGCGTLILIAIIVMIFSNQGGGSNNLKDEIKSLRDEVSILGDKVDTLTRAVEAGPQPVATDAQTGEDQIEAPEPGIAEAIEGNAAAEPAQADAQQ